MLFVDSETMLVRETSGPLDLLAAVVAESGCDHDAARCLLSPPSWAYLVGGHYRWSLGGAIWVFGQWVFRRVAAMPVHGDA